MTDKTRPNVLLITADQMRADCMSAANHAVVQTPHIDSLVASGVRFANAYTTVPVCVPARLSLMTGQYAHTHGVLGNRGMVPSDQPTVASLLAGAGYRTAAFGKMHFWPPYNPLGFEHMVLSEQDGPGWKIDDYHSQYLLQRGLVDWWDLWDQQKLFRKHAPEEYWRTFGAKGSAIAEEHHSTTWIADRTLDFIQELDQRPFFIWTSFIKPHHPFDPPKPWDTMYDPADMPPMQDQALALGKELLTNAGQRDPRKGYFDMSQLSQEAYRRVAAHYYGAISHVDYHVGRIIEALSAKGALSNTLIIFASDHGDFMGDYGLILKHPNVPYDSLAKVPLVMSGWDCQPGGVSDVPVSLIDILPTVTELMGIQTNVCMQGKSLVPLLMERTANGASFTRDAVFCETARVKAVRTARFKYLYNHDLRIEELYDVVADPKEHHDLAGDPAYKTVKSEMRERLLAWFLETECERYHGEWSHQTLTQS